MILLVLPFLAVAFTNSTPLINEPTGYTVLPFLPILSPAAGLRCHLAHRPMRPLVYHFTSYHFTDFTRMEIGGRNHAATLPTSVGVYPAGGASYRRLSMRVPAGRSAISPPNCGIRPRCVPSGINLIVLAGLFILGGVFVLGSLPALVFQAGLVIIT